MAALTTLTSTTLARAAGELDQSVSLASTSGVLPGGALYVDQELMQVLSLGLGTSVNVRRGVGGTGTTSHVSSRPVLVGRLMDFFDRDPVGPPPSEVLVSPWVNVLTGAQWTAQGDETGAAASRWWARTDHTHGVGALGVRTEEVATSAVTAT